MHELEPRISDFFLHALLISQVNEFDVTSLDSGRLQMTLMYMLRTSDPFTIEVERPKTSIPSISHASHADPHRPTSRPSSLYDLASFRSHQSSLMSTPLSKKLRLNDTIIPECDQSILPAPAIRSPLRNNLMPDHAQQHPVDVKLITRSALGMLPPL